MTHRQLLTIGLLLSFLPTLAQPAQGVEIYRQIQKIQKNQQLQQGNINHQYNEPGRQEVHGAVNESDCYNMERIFQRQGRKVRLVRVQRTNNPGAVLKVACIFQGEDADNSYYNDRRYR